MGTDSAPAVRPAFSVYAHLPWCVRRCPYCDFNTYAVRTIPEQRYTAALLNEIDAAATATPWQGRSITSVFFGGGTPSLFSPQSFEQLLARLDQRFGLDADAEITMEANPGTLEGSDDQRLAGWRAAGINRLSLGVQSFQEKHLATLGRLHGAAETLAAVGAARAAGFENLSLDLIFAIPGQSVAEWQADLEQAVALAPDHISAYGLTYEEGTPMTGLLQAGRITRSPEEIETAMLDEACALLPSRGYTRYEISNFAQTGRESRHNAAYWLRRDYLGLGAGAHGFADDPSRAGGGRRYMNQKFPEIYMGGREAGVEATAEELSRTEAIEETVMLGLRLARGLDRQAFNARFGVALEAALPAAAALASRELLVIDEAGMRMTENGLRLADSVIGEICTSVDS